MELAVNKMPGHIPGGGFHYYLHPLKMNGEREATLFRAMGYVIIEVPEKKGEQLLDCAQAALRHQIEVAAFTEAALDLET